MPGRLTPGRGSAHGQSSENPTPHLTLMPLDNVLGDDYTSRNLSKNHSTFSFGTDTPEVPTRRGSTAPDHAPSLPRRTGVTALLRPTGEGLGAAATARSLQPLPLSPNTNSRLMQNDPMHADWPSGSELAAVSDPNNLHTVSDNLSQNASQLQALTIVSPGSGNSSRSVGGCTTPPPVLHAAGHQTEVSAGTTVTTATVVTGVATSREVNSTGMGGSTTPTSLSPGRSMTLLERRTNRERSMVSISCLSGLNVETLQAGMRDTGVAVAEAQEKATPPTHGWSKTVASAALLSGYEVPQTVRATAATVTPTMVNSASATAAGNGSPNALDGGNSGGCSTANAVPSASPSASVTQQLPAATPAVHSSTTTTSNNANCSFNGASGAFRRASLTLPLNPELSSGATTANAVTPAAHHHPNNRASAATISNSTATAAGGQASKSLTSIPGAIKIASYNILASRLASTDLYPHCPPSVLSEEYRVNLIKEEVRLIDPDILLMEEISVGVHEESLGPFLKSALGLEGHHVVITDRNGQTRCSTRPPTASSTPLQKGPSSTRKKFDGVTLAALRGTGSALNYNNTFINGSNINASTPLAPASPSCEYRLSGEQNNANETAPSLENRSDGSALPPLVRAGSGTQFQPSRCSSATLMAAPAVGRKGCRSPRATRAAPSLSSMGATQTTLGTTNMSTMAPSHGDVLQRSNSALELGSITATSTATGAAAVMAPEARSARMSPRRKSTSEPSSGASPAPLFDVTAPADPLTAAGVNIGSVNNNINNDNHRRIEMDGVAVYYKANRFRVLEVVPVYFNALAAAEDRLTPYEHQKLQVNSHNVALLTVLLDTHAQGGPHVYIITAVHLIWQRVNAQLWQAHQLLRIIEDLKARYCKADGDFNPTTAMATVAARCSLVMDSFSTRPPSVVETPLNHEASGRPCMQRELPLPSTPARRRSISPCLTTAASDSTIEGGSVVTMAGMCTTNNNSTANTFASPAADRASCRRESVVSVSTTAGGPLVTCVIGGDFNSDRSGPVMEYLCTGRVPEGAPVMDYWKGFTPYTPPHRQQTDADVEKKKGTEGVHATNASATAHGTKRKSEGREQREGGARLPPLSVPALNNVAHTPCERSQRRTPQPEIGTLPCNDSTSAPLPVSPPSPTQPSMRPRRETLSLPEPLPMDRAGLTEMTTTNVLLLRPSTPPRQRQSPSFTGRTAISGVVSSSVESTPEKKTRVHSSAPARAVSAALAPRFPSDKTPYQPACMSNFRFGRGSTSFITSPISGSLVEVTAVTPGECSTVEIGSAPTVAATPPARALTASTSTSRTRGRSQDSQSSLSHSSRRHKLFKSGSQANTDYPFNASTGSTSMHSRRRTSPEALRSVESSTLIESAQVNKSISHSHSTSEGGSVLSSPFGTVSCPMKLPQHTRNDTLSPESNDAWWVSEDGQGPQQQQQQPSLPPPTLHSLFLDSPGKNGSLGTAAKAEQRAKPLPVFMSAAIRSHIGDGGGIFDSLVHPQLSQMDNCETPPAPKAGAKRRSVIEVTANAMSAVSTDGTYGNTPPASPQASRRRLNGMPGSAGTTSSAVPVERTHGLPAGEQHLSPSSSASASSLHEVPWPAALADATPSRPAKGLIDDVVHTVRLSDAYAPYCYRHPSRVSAVNPSTNMEGKVLDHILYEDEHVVCGAVLRLGEKQELPNARVPSDHYMIGAVLVPIRELRRS